VHSRASRFHHHLDGVLLWRDRGGLRDCALCFACICNSQQVAGARWTAEIQWTGPRSERWSSPRRRLNSCRPKPLRRSVPCTAGCRITVYKLDTSASWHARSSVVVGRQAQQEAHRSGGTSPSRCRVARTDGRPIFRRMRIWLICVNMTARNSQRSAAMANVFVEPTAGGYQIEFADGSKPKGPYATQLLAIAAARSLGHHPLVARVRHLNDKKIPDHWRAA
jgi:hypothetical protein